MKKWKKAVVLLTALLIIPTAGRAILGVILGPNPEILSPEDVSLLEQAQQLHRRALVIDAHDDVLTYIVDYDYDLAMNGNEPGDRSLFLYYGFSWLPFAPYGDKVKADMDFSRIREGGLNAQFFPAWVDCSTFTAAPAGASRLRALEMIDALNEQARRHPEHIQIARSAQEIQHISSDGKLAAILAIEGGHAIEDDLDVLAEYHQLGVRYITLTHTCSNNWADSSSDESLHGGLAPFGVDVIHEMNRLGIIVDVSHASDETFWDVIEVAEAPLMASHSNARSIADSPRNLTDEMIEAIGSNNGVVMINFMTLYLDPQKVEAWKVASGWHWFTHSGQTETSISFVVDHIDHVVGIAGIDHVGLGSDFDNTSFLPENLKDVGDYPNLSFELLRRGYVEEEIAKILGGNVLRVLADVERAAELMHAETAPR